MTIKRFSVPDYVRSVLICDPTDIWGNVVGIGLNELIACLTPAKRFDRRGEVIFVDNFEDGLGKWGTTTTGLLGAVAVSSTEALFGGLSAKLTGGSDSSRFAEIYYRIPPPPLSNLGLEFAVRPDVNVEYIDCYIDYYDGVTLYSGAISYDTVNEKWTYKTTAGAWVDFFTGAKMTAAEKLFHHCKLVIDPVGHKYVRALVSGEEKDMSTYDLYTDPDVTAPRVSILILVYSLAGYNAVGYVDSVIVTQNEPA